MPQVPQVPPVLAPADDDVVDAEVVDDDDKDNK